MRQQKHTLEERSRRLQNKRERAIQRRSQETSEETSGQTSRRLQNARGRQSQNRSQETSGQTCRRRAEKLNLQPLLPSDRIRFLGDCKVM